jgi:hypothetical protein
VLSYDLYRSCVWRSWPDFSKFYSEVTFHNGRPTLALLVKYARSPLAQRNERRLFSLNTRVTHIVVACIVVDQITSKGFLHTASYLEFSLHMHSFHQIRFRRLQPSQVDCAMQLWHCGKNCTPSSAHISGVLSIMNGSLRAESHHGGRVGTEPTIVCAQKHHRACTDHPVEHCRIHRLQEGNRAQ